MVREEVRCIHGNFRERERVNSLGGVTGCAFMGRTEMIHT